jgi:hypothetical protein
VNSIPENSLAPVSQNETEAKSESRTGNEPPVVIAKSTTASDKEVVISNPISIGNPVQVSDDYFMTGLNLNKTKESVFAESILFTEKKDVYPLSIESVVNSYNYTPKRKKLSWQAFFAPTISYRKLMQNKTFLNSGQSISSPYNFALFTNINSVVTHKPDVGLELGFSAGYPVTKNIKVIVGLQFNVSKYDIRAYSYPSEIATIALHDNGTGVSNSVSTLTNYRNFDGYKVNWLHNLYLSASVPVGAEFKVANSKKAWIGVSGTLQPTYILGDRAYLISSDYKNYAEVPWLIRKWNVNSSFETFAAYSTGKINWKVGPQVRYQLLSSFQEKYPVKEHLFDFGLKVGIMLNK